MTVRERIKIALDRSGKSQNDLANALGVRQGSVSAVLNRDTEFDSLKYLEATEVVTGFRFHWLRTGDGPELLNGPDTSMVNEPKLKYETKSIEALEKLVNTQALTIKLLEENIARLEQALQQQSKTGV